VRCVVIGVAVLALATAGIGGGSDAEARVSADANGSSIASIVDSVTLDTCTGDCDGDGAVSIGDLVRAVNIALGIQPLESCEVADADGDGSVEIGELIQAVTIALRKDGCAFDTPTASPTATATPEVPTETPQVPTATASAMHSPTGSPTATAAATATATPVATLTASPIGTATITPTSTATPTVSSPTPTPTGCPENMQLPVDSAPSCSISNIGDADVFRFTLTERTRVILQATEIPPDGQGGWDPCLELLPDLMGGSPIASQCDAFHPRLDQVLDPGDYFVLVSDNNNDQVGDYQVLYQPIRVPDAVELPPDASLARQINHAGDCDLYTFTLAAPTRVLLQVTEIPADGLGGWSPCLTVLTDLDDTAAIPLCDAFHPRIDQVLEAGTYYVLVNETDNYRLGDYEILYQPIQAPAASALPLDTQLAAQINQPGDYDLYTFTLAAPTRVLLQATEIPADGLGGWSPCLTVLTDLDDTAAIPLCDAFHPRIDQLLEAGTYYVLVNETDNYRLGDYEILYQPIQAPAASALPLDTQLAAQINQPGDYDLYTFTLAAPTRVLLQATEIPADGLGGWSPCLTVLTDPDDTAAIPLCDTFHPRIDEVLEAGTYYVFVNEIDNYRLGDYEILYQPVQAADAVALPIDMALAAQINQAGDYDLYSFTIAAPTHVLLQVTEIPPDGSGGWSPCLRILTDLNDTTAEPICEAFHPSIDELLQPDTYYVLVNETDTYRLGNYEILYQPLQ
jgi:hypothetical protein